MTFTEKLAASMTQRDSLVCIGLDSDTSRLPSGLTQFEFNRQIIDATHDLVCAYKPNTAFYEAQGAAGIQVFGSYLRDKALDFLVLVGEKMQYFTKCTLMTTIEAQRSIVGSADSTSAI